MEFFKEMIVRILTCDQTDVTSRFFYSRTKQICPAGICVKGVDWRVCCYHGGDWLMAINLSLSCSLSHNLCYSLQDSYCINNERLLSEMKVLCWYVGFRERWNENIERQMSDWTEASGELFIFIFLFEKNAQWQFCSLCYCLRAALWRHQSGIWFVFFFVFFTY